jgi:hypothetical protein
MRIKLMKPSAEVESGLALSGHCNGFTNKKVKWSVKELQKTYNTLKVTHSNHIVDATYRIVPPIAAVAYMERN